MTLDHRVFVYTQFAHTYSRFLSRCIKAGDKIVTLGSTHIYVQHRTQHIIHRRGFQDTWKETQAHSFAKWLTKICKLANRLTVALQHTHILLYFVRVCTLPFTEASSTYVYSQE